MSPQADDTRAARAGLASCWSCKGPVAAQALFCHTCGAIQPPGQLDHFRRLGLEPDFDLDLDLVEKRYLGFQRAIHPDRFATKPAKERALAERQAVALNEAYETLKDPLRRAAYLLQPQGPRRRGLQGRNGARSRAVDGSDGSARGADGGDQHRPGRRSCRPRPAPMRSPSSPSSPRPSRATISKAANRLTTRLKYLRKYLEETRTRRVALEQAQGTA